MLFVSIGLADGATAAASSSEQQQAEASSSKQQQAAASSSEQQRAAASSSEQQRAAASSSEQQKQQQQQQQQQPQLCASCRQETYNGFGAKRLAKKSSTAVQRALDENRCPTYDTIGHWEARSRHSMELV